MATNNMRALLALVTALALVQPAAAFDMSNLKNLKSAIGLKKPDDAPAEGKSAGSGIDWKSITNQQAATGAKEALEQGALSAVSTLSKENGFFGDANVKIPLPPTLAKGEKMLRLVGLDKQADELVLRMNRAAESAVAEATPILLGAIRNMGWQDVKDILTGPEDSLTRYFRKSCSTEIAARFLPKVKSATEKVRVAEVYNQVAGGAARVGLIGKDEANLDQFVTTKAVDGLFYMVGQKEKAIRADPLGQASQAIRTVFGALMR